MVFTATINKGLKKAVSVKTIYDALSMAESRQMRKVRPGVLNREPLGSTRKEIFSGENFDWKNVVVHCAICIYT